MDGRHLHGQLRAPEPTKAEREGAAIADMIAEANRRREAELDLIYGRADDYDPRHYSVRVGKGATKETRRVLREMERS